MVTKIKKWGNSLAIRIPSFVVKEMRLKDGTLVKLKIVNEKIIISLKKKKRKFTLDELVSKITPEKLHGEIDFGPLIGKELI